MSNKLPKHLQEMLAKREAKAKEFGLDLDWAVKAYEKAEKRGDDFNPIYGLIG